MVIYITDKNLDIVARCSSYQELIQFIDDKASIGKVYILSASKLVKEFIWGEDSDKNFKVLHKECLKRLKKKIINSFKIVVIQSNEVLTYHFYLPEFYNIISKKKSNLQKKNSNIITPEGVKLYQTVLSAVSSNSDLNNSDIQNLIIIREEPKCQ